MADANITPDHEARPHSTPCEPEQEMELPVLSPMLGEHPGRTTDSMITVPLYELDPPVGMVQSPEDLTQPSIHAFPPMPRPDDQDPSVGTNEPSASTTFEAELHPHFHHGTHDDHDVAPPGPDGDETEDEKLEDETVVVEPSSDARSEHLEDMTDDDSSSDAATDPDRPHSASDVNSSDTGGEVDWEELERNEEQEPRDEASDESTAFLLARLEQENNALAIDPKAGLSKPVEGVQKRSKSRPPSIHQLRKLVNEPTRSSLRYSTLPSPPPMTDLDFYAALVADFPKTAQRLPTLLSNKIRSGIPPPLRGVVWVSMAGARDRALEDQYQRLANETSPYEHLIGKDIGRSFPEVEMFRDSKGEGQQMLGRVLKCFSLYDEKIGYCQGLGFLVGPLLMHMGEREAFCVLVRLMEHYGLRACFLPDLSGLHLRIFQFQELLGQQLPTLAAHLDRLQIEAGYVSQWFLSFFAVTCPLPMLFRIYDVILAEGASETLMRVALSLMRRNEGKILACTEVEDVMQLLLSRGLWDAYADQADDLVNDFVGLTGVVTHESLEALETAFTETTPDAAARTGSLPDFQAVASRFLGRLWAGPATTSKPTGLSPLTTTTTSSSRPHSFLQRSPSKHSIASTLNSTEGGSDGSASTVPTEVSGMSRQASVAESLAKLHPIATTFAAPAASRSQGKDRDADGQIEDLLTALSEMQRDQAVLANELQREREEREEDRKVATLLVDRLRQRGPLQTVPEDEDPMSPRATAAGAETSVPMSPTPDLDGVPELLDLVEQRFAVRPDPRRSSILESKHQLRDELRRSKEQYHVEMSRSQDLGRQLADQEQHAAQLREQLKEARSLVQEGQREKQRLEQSMQELRARKPTPLAIDSSAAAETGSSLDATEARLSVAGGLRELRLSKPTTPVFSKRTSSLHALAGATPEPEPERSADEQSLLVELVHSKTAEAVAKQEAEELRAKLESLRKMIGGGLGASPSAAATTTGHRPSPSQPNIEKSATLSSFSSYLNSVKPASAVAVTGDASASTATPTPTPASMAGGFWGGWGKRSLSSAVSAVAAVSTVSTESS